MPKRILIINGPNLNLLGLREPDKYGLQTLESVNDDIAAEAAKLELEVGFFQSNSEGALVTAVQDAFYSDDTYDGIILNAGAYTHYSIALRDAISAIKIPVIEVHISNVHAREEFRHTSVIAPVCSGTIIGFGTKGYKLALHSFL
ncbi:MAG: type II 3-dehydroquinate dehydratase [Clostridiales Family XIII bacterium]|nr:type II 3-dehydroquinate dehydratase [Clostridiales Family XIII bacterium]